jgi:hypothetical protein
MLSCLICMSPAGQCEHTRVCDICNMHIHQTTRNATNQCDHRRACDVCKFAIGLATTSFYYRTCGHAIHTYICGHGHDNQCPICFCKGGKRKLFWVEPCTKMQIYEWPEEQQHATTIEAQPGFRLTDPNQFQFVATQKVMEVVNRLTLPH